MDIGVDRVESGAVEGDAQNAVGGAIELQVREVVVEVIHVGHANGVDRPGPRPGTGSLADPTSAA